MQSDDEREAYQVLFLLRMAMWFSIGGLVVIAALAVLVALGLKTP